jgi:hypothetical protein
MTDSARIQANLQRILAEIRETLISAGRAAEAARLVAVTKSAGLDEIAALARLGQTILGENRGEQLQERADWARTQGLQVQWHMIGHLQRRKVRDLLPQAAMIHSVDSLRLAEEIESRAAAAVNPSPFQGEVPASGGGEGAVVVARLVIPILLETNVSGEVQKYGVRPEEAPELLRRLADLPHLDLRGLMTMAPLADDAELSRPVFRALRELRDRLNDAGCYPRPLTELSMGMSQDYRVALQEGATLVRIGTALFE